MKNSFVPQEKLIQKIENKEPLTREDFRSFLEYEIDRIEDEFWNIKSGRKNASTISELCGRTFRLDWKIGWTLNDEFPNRPYEVIKKEIERKVIDIVWERKI